METLRLVCLRWVSEEREKYVWEDRHIRPWDEIIGRMYLLKAHDAVESKDYVAALGDFELALALFAKEGVNQDYYGRALADKALVQCFLGQYEAALAAINQAIPVTDPFYQNAMLSNRCAILVLTGAFSDALSMLSTQLDKDPEDSCLRFTLATCLLRLERYQEAVAAYEQVISEGSFLGNEGLVAARLGQQPDWANL